jgi:hypothetical protein
MRRDEEPGGGAVRGGEGCAKVWSGDTQRGGCYFSVSVLTTSIMRPGPVAGGPGNFNLAADWSSGRRMRGAAAAMGILILSPRAGGLPRPSPGCRKTNKKRKQKINKKDRHWLLHDETYRTRD